MQFENKNFKVSSNDFGYYYGFQKNLVENFIHNLKNDTAPLFEFCEHKVNVENFQYYKANVENIFSHISNVKLRHKIRLNKYNESFLFSSEDVLIGITLDGATENIYLHAYTKKAEIFHKIDSFFLDIKQKKQKKENIYVLTERKGELEASSVSNKKFELETGNYSPKIIEDYNYIEEEFNKEKPFGRIAIFAGPAGTGKTHLIKSLSTSVENCMSIFIPIGLAPYLDKPSFMDFLLGLKEDQGENKGFLFIIEDADQILVDRSEGNYSLLSAFLNFTDGLIGDCLNVRFLATTNSDFIKIDDAFKRPGRLLRYSNVDLLQPKEAENVYRRLTNANKIYEKPVALAQIYADSYSKMNGIVEKKKQSLGFGS